VKQSPLTMRRWSRAEYDRLIELGAFDGDPIELLGGQLVVAEPQRPYHASAVSSAAYALMTALPQAWIVRTQLPVWLDDESEPEPDLAVVPGCPADYRLAHPARPVLIIEVAEASLAFDRKVKSSLYWIVNLVDRVVEVYRNPVPDAAAAHAWSYETTTILNPPAAVTPLAFPGIRINVADLLP